MWWSSRRRSYIKQFEEGLQSHIPYVDSTTISGSESRGDGLSDLTQLLQSAGEVIIHARRTYTHAITTISD